VTSSIGPTAFTLTVIPKGLADGEEVKGEKEEDPED